MVEQRKLTEWVDWQRPFFSLEYFPPKTDEGFRNLIERVERMKKLGPTWVDVTWGAGGRNAERSLELCAAIQQEVQVPVMMHLTCSNVPKASVKSILEQAKDAGIRNILALRGDPPLSGVVETPLDSFQHAIELVQYIRAEYGDLFCIAVAGYPEGHFESKSFDDDISNLKAKVDAGADFIVTQLFYDVDIFKMFIRECNEAGIQCPIVAGLMPIYSFERFNRITHLTQVIVPEDVIRRLYSLRLDDERVREYGVAYLADMVNQLHAAGVKGFHFYTLNLEKSIVQILRQISFFNTRQPDLPWHTMESEVKVTPAAIARYRPKEFYMNTTKFDWDDFPHERWGDTRSAAYMSFLDDVWYASLQNSKIRNQLQLSPAEVQTESDISNIFVSFIKGELKALPWTPESLSLESNVIRSDLIELNRAGLLTISSQPAVNGESSAHPVHGWGPKNGHVYQKAFVEFFCSASLWSKLKAALPSHLQYMAVQAKGDVFTSFNFGRAALTWGVFPDSEIIESTRLEIENFLLWREQAFELWQSSWGSHVEGAARQVLEQIQQTYWLVNLVDDDFKQNRLFGTLRQIVASL